MIEVSTVMWIDIPGGQILRRKNYGIPIPDNSEFKDCNIMYCNEIFRVLVAEVDAGPEYKTAYFIKPHPTYSDIKDPSRPGFHVFEYEQLFGFNRDCTGFDLEKLILVIMKK